MRDYDNETTLRGAWKVFDKDSAGTISTAELRHVLASIGEKLSPEELDEMTKEADPEGRGRIEYDTFLKTMMAR